MKAKLIEILGFFGFAAAVSSLFSLVDTAYHVFAGSYLTDGFRSALDFFAQNAFVNWVLLLVTAAFFWLISLLYSFVRRKSLSFDRGRWAFVFGPSICILAWLLIAVPVNMDALPHSLSTESLVANAAMALVALAAAVAAAFIGPAIIGFFQKRWAKVSWTALACLFFICAALNFVALPKPTSLPPDYPIDGPNVIIITIDALRQDRVGVYGKTEIETPNLDAFAARSLRFNEACTASPWTVPSMYTMLSSRYPSVHGADKTVRGHPEIIMMSELLKSHGYRTEAYTANPIMYGELGFEDGFDVYIEHGDVLPLIAFNKTTAYRFVKKLRDAIFERSNVAGGDSTEWLTGCLLRAFNKKSRRPLFLWAHYLDPHTPLTPPREYVRGTPEFVEGALSFGRSETIFYENLVAGDLDVLIPLYEAEVRYVDDKFGEVSAAMEDNGFFENSVIIVTADHGEEFFEHGAYGHGKTHYNEVISIPMFIYTPDGDPGVVDYPASLVDVTPTVLEYVGAEVPPDMSGESLLPLIEGSGGGRNGKYIFMDRTQTDPHLKSVRLAPYTLIRSGAGDYAYEMVDNTVTKTPEDIVENPDPEVYGAMREVLDEWAVATNEEAEALGEAVGVELDAERREKLKGLGYLN